MNMLLLIFFALPIAVIIVSIALQRILKSPILVAAIIFSIFIVVTFIVADLNLLIATIIYTIISYITAIIVCLICRFLRSRDLDCFNCIGLNARDRNRERDSNFCNCQNLREGDNFNNELLRISSNCQNFDNGNLLTISSNGCNGVTNDLLTVNSSCIGNNSNNVNSSNCSNNNNSNTVSARINVIPNDNGNGRTGTFSGSYRRRC